MMKGRRPPAANRHYKDIRAEARDRALGLCQADGLHASDCPGYGTACHHILTESRAKQLGLDWADIDTLDNVIWVHGGWNGSVSCHARIHSYPHLARQLGYLRDRPAD